MEEPVKVELSDEEKALMYRKLELSDLTDRNSARIFFHFFSLRYNNRDVWLASDDLGHLVTGDEKPSSDIQKANEKMNDG